MQNESIINFDVFWNATHDLGMTVPYFCRGVSERCDFGKEHLSVNFLNVLH